MACARPCGGVGLSLFQSHMSVQSVFQQTVDAARMFPQVGRRGLKGITAVDKLGAAGAAAVPEAAKDGFVQSLLRLSFWEARISGGDRSFSVRYFRSRRG